MNDNPAGKIPALFGGAGVDPMTALECCTAILKDTKADNERLKAELEHIQAELQRLTTWQPIETAPRDGTAILGCQGWCIEVTAYHKGTKPYHRKEAWVVANDDEGYAQDFQPTHWMPLPNPDAPVKQTKSKGAKQ